MDKCIKEVTSLIGGSSSDAIEVVDYLINKTSLKDMLQNTASKFNISPIIVANIFQIMRLNKIA